MIATLRSEEEALDMIVLFQNDRLALGLSRMALRCAAQSTGFADESATLWATLRKARQVNQRVAVHHCGEFERAPSLREAGRQALTCSERIQCGIETVSGMQH